MKNLDVKKFQRLLETSVTELNHSTRQRDAIRIVECADELERIQGANERELAGRSLQLVSTKQRQVQAALRRISEGTFGICLECDEPISSARLNAMPWAMLCIRCQEAKDCDCGATRTRPYLPMAA